MDDIKISLLESPGDDISEVRIDGVIDTITAAELEEVVDTLMKRDRCRVVVDLAGVDYVSSAGWGIFISHIRDVRSRGGDIKLANMIPNVYEIYDLLEFDNVIKAYPSVDDARNDFGRPTPGGGLKKKDQKVTGVTVVDRVTSVLGGHGVGTAVASPVGVSYACSDVDTLVLRYVKDDPFASLGEIRRGVADETPGGRITWWRVFGILRRRGLLTRRSRYRFVRGR
jgi:anti-sigma B factor antagonist